MSFFNTIAQHCVLRVVSFILVLMHNMSLRRKHALPFVFCFFVFALGSSFDVVERYLPFLSMLG